uniref:NADH-ubiquinone oxidoreductase chain 2 n=1 Tax=Cerion incanum TaxID=145432 RepID=A0A0A0QXC8_9EUPU|nr:NADH dehydrogenase subunit 2 [Cerion incanum]AIU94468.1 NADH dehydrogenase subunit 2 [Cerion incanum]
MVSLLLLTSTLVLIGSAFLMGDIILTWLMMEVSMLTFLCWAGITKYNSLTSEGLMFYFVSQSYSGIFMIVVMIWNIYFPSNIDLLCIVATIMLGIKIGLFPLHFWVYPTVLSLEWSSLLLMMTVLKIVPLGLAHEFMFLVGSPDQFPSSMTLWMAMSILSLMFGTIYGLGASSLRHMLAASSIVHGGWLVLGMMSYSMWWYFLGYFLSMCMLITSIEKQEWYNVGLYLLMLGGLPPFLMFVLKMYVLAKGVLTGVYVSMLTVAALSAAISLFYYLKFSYSFMLSSVYFKPSLQLIKLLLMSFLFSGSLSILLVMSFF